MSNHFDTMISFDTSKDTVGFVRLSRIVWINSSGPWAEIHLDSGEIINTSSPPKTIATQMSEAFAQERLNVFLEKTSK